MKSIKLDLSTVEVESFDVGEEPAVRGTVHGHGPTNEGANTCDTCRPALESWCAPCIPDTDPSLCPFTNPRFDPNC